MILAFVQSLTTLFVFVLLSLLPVIPVAKPSISVSSACPAGRSAAKLTGWMLNNKNPVGSASYDETAKSLEIKVSNVALPDGTRLSILIGEEKIGEMEPLKDGSARAVISSPLPDQARVRVFEADRPIVSANLQCVNTPVPAPTISPSPSPSVSPAPLPSPSISPSPSPSPGPTAEPTPDPMPKHSPVPSPSPR